MNTIESEWLTFKMLVAKDLLEEDMIPYKVSFFSGAYALLGLQTRLATEKYSEESSAAILEGIYEELNNFFNNHNKGLINEKH